jgi:hypothetical protein
MCDECGSNEMRVFFTRKEGSFAFKGGISIHTKGHV